MKTWIQKIISLLILIILFAIGTYYLTSDFKAGNCVQGLDGYTWHINRYRLGEYNLMGWQDPWWGNEVRLNKDILERKDASGIPMYHQIECPTRVP